MSHFILEPNYSLLKDHLFSHLNNDEWQQFISTYDGQPMQMASLVASSKEQILKFQYDFIDTLAGIGEFQQDRSDYNLIEHFHNLLALCLYAYEDYYTTMEYYNDSYQSEVCLQELAQMLLLYENNPDRSIEISFKLGSQKVKITDGFLSQWIGQTVKKELNDYKQLPIVLGDHILHTFQNGFDPSKLEKAAVKRIKKPIAERNKAIAQFCFKVLGYLNAQTLMKSAEGAIFSDAQLNLLFDVGVLFDFFKRRKIDAEPKDYMGTFLKNYINKIK